MASTFAFPFSTRIFFEDCDNSGNGKWWEHCKWYQALKNEARGQALKMIIAFDIDICKSDCDNSCKQMITAQTQERDRSPAKEHEVHRSAKTLYPLFQSTNMSVIPSMLPPLIVMAFSNRVLICLAVQLHDLNTQLNDPSTHLQDPSKKNIIDCLCLFLLITLSATHGPTFPWFYSRNMSQWCASPVFTLGGRVIIICVSFGLQ
jgi:hypothetical protein